MAVALLVRLGGVGRRSEVHLGQFRGGEFLVPGDAAGEFVESGVATSRSAGPITTIGEHFMSSRDGRCGPRGFPLAARRDRCGLDLLAGTVHAVAGVYSGLVPLPTGGGAVRAPWRSGPTGRLGRAVAGGRAGTVAAWLAAVNPLAVAYSVMLLSESLFALLATVSLWGVAECVRPDETPGEAVAAVAAGDRGAGWRRRGRP